MNLRWPAGVAVLLAAAGGAWLEWRAWQAGAPSGGSPSSAGSETTGRTVVLALGTVPVSGETSPRVTLSPDTGTLRLVLALPARSVRSWLSAALKTAAGAPVWRGDVVAPDRTPQVIADVPARRIMSGDYRVVLRRAGSGGFAEIASYPFTVVRE